MEGLLKEHNDHGKKANIPDLLCVPIPLRSYQALYHGEENLESACIQLYLSARGRK